MCRRGEQTSGAPELALMLTGRGGGQGAPGFPWGPRRREVAGMVMSSFWGLVITARELARRTRRTLFRDPAGLSLPPPKLGWVAAFVCAVSSVVSVAMAIRAAPLRQ